MKVVTISSEDNLPTFLIPEFQENYPGNPYGSGAEVP
jgi:hypothetical protein